MGATHFLTRGLERVKTEMSLHVLAYNFRRLLALLGTANMMKAIRAYARFLRRHASLWDAMLLALSKRSTATYRSLRCATVRFSIGLGHLAGALDP
jgi:hypothetical protein